MRARHAVYALVLVSAIGMGVVLTLEVGWSNLPSIGAFYGSILVTIGWVLTAEVTIRNSKRQHTITVLTQQAFTKEREDRLDIVKQKLPHYYSKLTPEMVDFDQERDALLKAIDYELDFYEFIAAGLHNDHFDRVLVENTIKSRCMRFVDQAEHYIGHWQSKPDGKTTWAHLMQMYKHWKK
jgi:hypothetical protein